MTQTVKRGWDRGCIGGGRKGEGRGARRVSALLMMLAWIFKSHKRPMGRLIFWISEER